MPRSASPRRDRARPVAPPLCSRFVRVAALAGAACVLTTTAASLVARQPMEPVNGVRQIDPGRHAVVGAAVVVRPGETIEDATVLVEDGTITAVGRDVEIPAGMRRWDASGLTLTAGLVEPWLEVATPDPDPAAPGTHWNEHVRAQTRAVDTTDVDADAREAWRKRGRVVVHAVPESGLLRGRSAILTLGEDRPGDPAATVVRETVAHVVGIRRAGGRGGGYPSSRMGGIAMLRQSLADAAWRREAIAFHAEDPAAYPRPVPDDAMDALGKDAPLLLDAQDELDLLRLVRTANEFDRPFMVAGCGTEFRRASAVTGALAEREAALVLPLTLPDTPEVGTIAERENVTLRDLMTWEHAPTNAVRLLRGGVEVAFTANRLRRGESFEKNLARVLEEGGLDADTALAAMTTVPARMLGIDDRYGTIEAGKSASFVLSEGPLTDEKPGIRATWVDGVPFEIEPPDDPDATGDWAIAEGPLAGDLAITGEPGRPSIAHERESRADDAEEAEADDAANDDDADGDGDEPEAIVTRARGVRQVENRIDFMLDAEGAGLADATGMIAVSLVLEGTGDDARLVGEAVLPGGEVVAITATREADDDANDETGDEGDADDDEASADDEPDLAPLPVPLGAYGVLEMPEQEKAVLTGATIWTTGPQGIVRDGAIVIEGGTIRWVGPASELPGGLTSHRVVDLEGRHVTPGLIDCHSHTGISGGVNEGTQSVTCEVGIEDVIDPDAIGWWRQLATGITAVNQLHGSANPIGGRNSVVKLRWGVEHPDDMRVEGARPGVKFALGENVKQSNWGAQFRTRYPQTRMGVETIMIDRLQAGLEYRAAVEAWEAGGRVGPGPRPNLERVHLAEIASGERLIHCHSYRQDEILMLCRVAERFGIRIGTFQHVLEGYKVAEAIREHAIGASAFSDWWAYKFEVFDAIPEAGAIMHEVGVNVSFNSDSNELARRMAGEAAKAVKYGGVAPEEALAFVTLNPAIQLDVADRVGSIETGKDADLAVWSGPPLSSLSRTVQTWVDGRLMWSDEIDRARRADVARERDRIIQVVLAEGNGGGDGPGRGRPSPDRDRGRDMIDGPEPDAGAIDARLAAAFEAAGFRRMTSGAGTDEAPLGWIVDPLGRTLPPDVRRWLETEIEFLRMNGLEPIGHRPGDCGCSVNCVLQHR